MIIKSNILDYQTDYKIYKKEKSDNLGLPISVFETHFYPSDIPDTEDMTQTAVFQRICRHSFDNFIDSLNKVSLLHQDPELSSFLPDIHSIHEAADGVFAESTFYEGSPLNEEKQPDILLHKLFLICKAETQIIEKTGCEPGVLPQYIIFEPDNDYDLHFLHLDFSQFLADEFRIYAANCLSQALYGRTITFRDRMNSFKDMTEPIISFHPSVLHGCVEILRILVLYPHVNHDWIEALNVCNTIKSNIKCENYFMNKVQKPCINCCSTTQIDEIYEKENILIMNGSIETARNYAFNNRKKYIMTAEGDAHNGISAMLESSDLAMKCDHEEHITAEKRLALLTELEADSTLLIVKNCSLEDDDMLPSLLRLPLDILFVVSEDYSDCGIPYIDMR